jgi:biotin synthase
MTSIGRTTRSSFAPCLSIKTGGCSEDCGYCAQSARYTTSVQAEKLMPKEQVMERALAARASGSTRFCMGAAWKGVRKGTQKFDQVLDIVRDVSKLGMEVCVTLGELGADEAADLKEAGVTAYNHNVDTSPENYPNIVSTHTFEDRLRTIRHAQDAGMSVCCGGILGLGETIDDRLKMLEVISNFNPQPESIPINAFMPIKGTPMGDNEVVDAFAFVRMIAVTRIAVPKAKVRLSAGRTNLSREAQALAYFAGANSIFYGDKLLTTANPRANEDMKLLRELGLAPLGAESRPRSPRIHGRRAAQSVLRPLLREGKGLPRLVALVLSIKLTLPWVTRIRPWCELLSSDCRRLSRMKTVPAGSRSKASQFFPTSQRFARRPLRTNSPTHTFMGSFFVQRRLRSIPWRVNSFRTLWLVFAHARSARTRRRPCGSCWICLPDSRTTFSHWRNEPAWRTCRFLSSSIVQSLTIIMTR